MGKTSKSLLSAKKQESEGRINERINAGDAESRGQPALSGIEALEDVDRDGEEGFGGFQVFSRKLSRAPTTASPNAASKGENRNSEENCLANRDGIRHKNPSKSADAESGRVSTSTEAKQQTPLKIASSSPTPGKNSPSTKKGAMKKAKGVKSMSNDNSVRDGEEQLEGVRQGGESTSEVLRGPVEVGGPDEGAAMVQVSSFESLGLGEWLVATCKEMGLKKPTPVQAACIPPILRGEDVIGTAQTGSGKTAAFALPILQKLAEDPYGIFALILTPTRELAFQIADQFRVLGAGARLRDAVVVGGMGMTEQARALMQRPHVVIATPGRLRDHIQNNLDIARCFARAKFLVLDEADRLFERGFAAEIQAVLEVLPERRQTLLFSATLTGDVRALERLAASPSPAQGEGSGKGGRRREVFVFRAYEGLQTADNLRQEYLFVPLSVKDVYLFHIAQSMEESGARSAIIFTSSCRACHTLELLLEELGIGSASLHSLKPQPRRLAALDRFKSGLVPILIATDVASRGLDIPTVDLVVNYDVPRYARDYVHRVGRTARAGRGGQAVTLVTQYDVELVQEIETLIGQKLEEFKAEEKEVLKDITKVFKAKRVVVMAMADSGFEELVESRKEGKRKQRLAKAGLTEAPQKNRNPARKKAKGE